MPKPDISNGYRGGQRPDCTCYRKARRAQSITDYETWVDAEVANTINAFDIGDIRSTNIVVTKEESDEVEVLER